MSFGLRVRQERGEREAEAGPAVEEQDDEEDEGGGEGEELSFFGLDLVLEAAPPFPTPIVFLTRASGWTPPFPSEPSGAALGTPAEKERAASRDSEFARVAISPIAETGAEAETDTALLTAIDIPFLVCRTLRRVGEVDRRTEGALRLVAVFCVLFCCLDEVFVLCFSSSSFLLLALVVVAVVAVRHEGHADHKERKGLCPRGPWGIAQSRRTPPL